MASSSKPKEDPTPEEIMARKRMITGGQYAGTLLDITPGTEIMMNSNGSNGFSMGPDPSDRFMWNEKTGDYRSNGGGIARIAEMPQAAATTGGGGGGGAPASDWRESVRQTSNPVDDQGKTTADILGDSYDSMNAYTPVTPGQVVNPLVQAGNWVTQVNPANQVAYTDPGIYINPQVGMLQDSWSNTSTNPYSLLG